MWHLKNLPRWERAARLAAALLMAVCAWRYHGSPMGWIFAASSLVTAVTAILAYCPMCAVSGRKPVHSGTPTKRHDLRK